MFRNVVGSIGISLATALITERTQVRHAYLTDNLGPLDPGYQQTLAQITRACATRAGTPPPCRRRRRAS